MTQNLYIEDINELKREIRNQTGYFPLSKLIKDAEELLGEQGKTTLSAIKNYLTLDRQKGMMYNELQEYKYELKFVADNLENIKKLELL